MEELTNHELNTIIIELSILADNCKKYEDSEAFRERARKLETITEKIKAIIKKRDEDLKGGQDEI